MYVCAASAQALGVRGEPVRVHVGQRDPHALVHEGLGDGEPYATGGTRDDGNTAWEALLGGGPVQVRRGRLKVGEREEAGNDLACLFVRPRPGSDTALVGAVSGTGVAGLRRTDRLPYFVSGVGYPDWVVLDGTSWTRGVEGIRGAGYFGLDWEVESGESAWRK